MARNGRLFLEDKYNKMHSNVWWCRVSTKRCTHNWVNTEFLKRPLSWDSVEETVFKSLMCFESVMLMPLLGESRVFGLSAKYEIY